MFLRHSAGAARQQGGLSAFRHVKVPRRRLPPWAVFFSSFSLSAQRKGGVWDAESRIRTAASGAGTLELMVQLFYEAGVGFLSAGMGFLMVIPQGRIFFILRSCQSNSEYRQLGYLCHRCRKLGRKANRLSPSDGGE